MDSSAFERALDRFLDDLGREFASRKELRRRGTVSRFSVKDPANNDVFVQLMGSYLEVYDEFCAAVTDTRDRLKADRIRVKQVFERLRYITPNHLRGRSDDDILSYVRYLIERTKTCTVELRLQM